MINANKEYDAFMAYANEVQMPEAEHERGYVIWLAAKRHAAQVGWPDLEQQHAEGVALFLASAPVAPVDVLWGGGEVAEKAAETRMDAGLGGGAERATDAPSGASVDSPAPCPHCGAAMSGDADFMTHPENDCWMSGWEYSQTDIAKWNRRVSVDSVARDAVRYQWLLENYAIGDGYTAIDNALNYGEPDKLSAAIDAAMSPTKAGEGE